MKEKLKKQRKSITIKISSVLLVVWLIVSSVFATIVLYIEKQEQITKSHNDYNYLVESITAMQAPPYNEVCKYVQVVKERWVDIVTMDIVPETNCGADGTYDKNLQITVSTRTISEDVNYFTLMDTDKEIYVAFLAEDYSNESTANAGILNYDEFVNSMTEEQLDTIVKYLKTKKDKDGYLYLLRCAETYYNPENGHIYPKTVEIVKSYEDTNGYGVSEITETYELNPETTEGLQIYSYKSNEPCIIDGQFVCNNFSSGGLIEDPFFKLDYELYDRNTGIVEKTGLFTYHCTEGGTISIETLTFEGSKHAQEYVNAENNYRNNVLNSDLLFPSDIEELENEFVNPVGYINQPLNIRYVKRINLLGCCGDTLIFGISVLFLFFLIIGVILTVMMHKVFKTQMLEEEKRRETTNALAHDIKTPLFIISGYAQNLKENINEEKKDHYCDRIIERTKEVNELVHKMLDFSKLSSIDHKLNLESVDLNQILNDALKDYEALPQGKKFRLNVDAGCTAQADRTLLFRAVSYLIDNAIKYSDESSDIDINLSENSLAISNKCSTITNEDVKHITEPYYRVEKNRESKGNGLGLSIVKSITEAHNFELDIKLIDSTITFTIVFHK